MVENNLYVNKQRNSANLIPVAITPLFVRFTRFCYRHFPQLCIDKGNHF